MKIAASDLCGCGTWRESASVIHKITYGVSTVRRLLKYSKQGYTVCSGALAAILNEVVTHPEVIHAETAYVD